MPDNIISGMLEDFVSLLIPANEVLWSLAEASVKQAIAVERRFPETQVIKAYIQQPGSPGKRSLENQWGWLSRNDILMQPRLVLSSLSNEGGGCLR